MCVPMSPAIGPYLGVREKAEVDHGINGKYLIFAYAAYNAHGLIGTECNGVAVLTPKGDHITTVVDEILCSPFNGVTPSMTHLVRQLSVMPWPEFREFINRKELDDHRRFKLEDFKPGQSQRAKLTPANIRKLVRLLTGDYIDGYKNGGAAKTEWSNLAKRYLHDIGHRMGCKKGTHKYVPQPGEYIVSFNPGGPAVTGDVYLDANLGDGKGIHVNLSQSCLGPSHGFMYRHAWWEQTDRGIQQRDGSNRWMKFEQLMDPQVVADTFMRVAQGPVPQPA